MRGGPPGTGARARGAGASGRERGRLAGGGCGGAGAPRPAHDQPEGEGRLGDPGGGGHGVRERSFQRLFSTETGISPGRPVERSRIDAARMMLEQTEEGVVAIAARCGFARQETFLRAFRRVVGVSPTEYRRGFARPPGPLPAR